MSHRWLLISVHHKVREFHGKLLLAWVAAEKGFNVVLGPTGVLRDNMERLPRGVLMDVTISPTRDQLFARYRGLGNRVTSFCEEATAIDDYDTFRAARISERAISSMDLVFTWGNEHTDLVLEVAPHAGDKIRTCGHPRFDLLRPELRGIYDAAAQELRARFGRYILVNSNMAVALLEDTVVEEDWQKLVRRNQFAPGDKDRYLQRVAFKRKSHEALMGLIPELARGFPDRTIVVRPKFNSLDAPWVEELHAALPNIVVVHEGGVAPWILGAEAMVHRDCTTGIEGYLLDTPVFSYESFDSAPFGFKAHLPTALSHSVHDANELITALERTPKVGRSDETEGAVRERRHVAAHHIGAIDGPLASDRIVDALADLEVEAVADEEADRALSGWLERDRRSRRSQTSTEAPEATSDTRLTAHEARRMLGLFQRETGRFGDVTIQGLNEKKQLLLIRRSPS